MKKFISVIAALIFAACGFFFLKNNEKPAPDSLKMPGGANEDNKAQRRAWDRIRFADPATGEIPKGIAFLERYFAQNLPMAVHERSSDWVARGPWNVGGRTRAIALDVNNENRILAGGVSGGIWLSEDGGQSWARKTPLDAHPGCISIAQDTRPGHTGTWYYISGEIYGTSASGGEAFYLGDGMFKSTDSGNTWAPLGATDNGSPNAFTNVWQGAWRVITNPADTVQDVVYAATYGAIFRSINGGTSWSVVRGSANNSPFSYFTDIAITSTGVLYATLSSDGLHKGIWRSANGTQWTNITPSNFPAVYDRIVVGINPNNENEVYFLGFTPGSGHYNNYIDSDDWTSLWKYTWLSGDGSGAGGQWDDRSMNLPNLGTEFDRFAAQGGYDLVVKIQPGTNHVFIGGTNIYRSTDGFATPDNTTHIGGYKPGTFLPYFELYPNHHPDIHDLLFLPSDPDVMLSATDGGLHRTEDCNAAEVNWTSLNNGYQTTQFYTAIIDKNEAGDNTIIGGLQDNGNFFANSSDPQATWKQTINGDGSFGAVAPGKDFYVISIHQGRVAKCILDDAGNVTAYQRFDPIGRVKGDYLFINPLALDPNDSDILYLPAGDRLYRQDDLGAIPLNNEWDSISTGWTLFPDTLQPFNDNNARHVISAIAVSESNPGHRVYIGTSRNKVYRIDDAHTGAPAFTALPSPLGATAAYVTCLAVDPADADRVILCYSNYGIYSIFLSEDAGLSWQKVGGNLEANVGGSGNAPSIRWMSILPFADGSRKYFCATSTGLYSADTLKLHSLTEAGTEWELEAPDLIGSAVVAYTDVRPSDGLVVAATHGNGLFSANFMTVSAGEPPRSPAVQVFPNPARDFVVFDIDVAEQVSLRLFDQQGKLVRSSSYSGGKERVDLSVLPAGIYLYELRGKGWSDHGKLVKG